MCVFIRKNAHKQNLARATQSRQTRQFVSRRVSRVKRESKRLSRAPVSEATKDEWDRSSEVQA